MRITNNTLYNYETIGRVIDQIQKNSIGSTHYVGQIEYTTMEMETCTLKIRIKYYKSHVEWRFDYL